MRTGKRLSVNGKTERLKEISMNIWLIGEIDTLKNKTDTGENENEQV